MVTQAFELMVFGLTGVFTALAIIFVTVVVTTKIFSPKK